MRVKAANVREVGILVELAHRVAAQERKGVGVGQLIPEHFKTDGGVVLTRLPQNVDHLAVYTNRAIRSTATRLRDYVAHGSQGNPRFRDLRR